ncbi:MAG: serine/threonine protein kinase [Kofleriaceae bacterium]|nr:serine/threonine protein kinase [Kofleriaceae bacterium]
MTLLQKSDGPSLLIGGQSLPIAGEQFDKYTLLAKLATGGMAELFVARLSGAAGFSKTVVIKRILPHVAHDENFTQMFLDEALTCAQITHPNVCQVFELCESNGSHFLVLEHLEGATVGDLIRRCIAAEQQLNLRLAAGIIVQACDGLQAAHEQVDDEGKSIGLVHRDISPANLFVTVHGIVKVLDFGIAKAAWMSRKTRTGTLLGKCEYMSPEQARGGVPVDRRSDIFSLGITAWELLCGRRLFRRETEYDTLKAVLRAPIENPRSLRPTIPEALDQAIMCALERDREDRFHTAYDFRKAIADSLRPQGGPTPMCDIAPVIRKSFADDIKIQRATVREAAALSQKFAPVFPSPASPSSQSPIPTPVEEEYSDKTYVNKSRQRAQSQDPSEQAGSDSDEFDSNKVETEIHLPRSRAHSPAPDKGQSENRPDSHPAEINPARNAMPAASPAPKRKAGANIGVIVAVILLSACVAAAGTYVAVTLLNKRRSNKATPTPASSVDSAASSIPIPAKSAASGIVAQVTALNPASVEKLGSLTISSAIPAKIYLYPDKKLLGTTPIPSVELPVGTHKLKATLDSGQKRYFQVEIKVDENTNRLLSNW